MTLARPESRRCAGAWRSPLASWRLSSKLRLGVGRGRGQVEKSVLPLEEVRCKQNNGEHDFKKKSQETLLVIKFIRGVTEFFLRLTL